MLSSTLAGSSLQTGREVHGSGGPALLAGATGATPLPWFDIDAGRLLSPMRTRSANACSNFLIRSSTSRGKAFPLPPLATTDSEELFLPDEEHFLAASGARCLMLDGASFPHRHLIRLAQLPDLLQNEHTHSGSFGPGNTNRSSKRFPAMVPTPPAQRPPAWPSRLAKTVYARATPWRRDARIADLLEPTLQGRRAGLSSLPADRAQTLSLLASQEKI